MGAKLKVEPERRGLGMVRQEVELAVRVPCEPSTLTRLFTTIAACYTDISAWCFYSDHQGVLVFLVTTNEPNTGSALAAHGFIYTSSRVLLVQGPDGTASAITLGAQLRAAGITLLSS